MHATASGQKQDFELKAAQPEHAAGLDQGRYAPLKTFRGARP